jgi:hypothetical protein
MTTTEKDEDADTHAPIIRGDFYPFKYSSMGDFKMEELAERLKLKPLQTELLTEWLNQLEIKIWFWDAANNQKDLRRDPPGFEINVFWDPFECSVSSANLFDLLKAPLESDYLQIDNEKEIAALEKLKAMIDESIVRHRSEK